MRSALALSALLLLLLQPPASLSQNDSQITGPDQSEAQMTATLTTTTSTTTTLTTTTLTTTNPTTTTPTTTIQTTTTPTTTTLTTTTSTTTTPTTTTQGNTTLAPTLPPATSHSSPSTTDKVTTNQEATQKTGEMTTNQTASQPTESQTTKAQPTPRQSAGVTPPPPDSVTTSNTTAAPPSIITPSSTPRLTSGPVTSKFPGSCPEVPKGVPTASSSSGSMADHSSPFQGTPTTLTPLSTSQGSQQTSGEMPPAVAQTTSSGPAATTPVRSLSPQIECQPPERQNKKMLILNVTETRFCGPKTSPDDKLVKLLCQAAKSTFNPKQDQCHIQLVPVSETHQVAIKEISIRTNLPPSDVFEFLKDKWEDLKEVGVSDMRLGDQGPPEETEDRFSMPLIITIVCMASFLLLVAALYGCCHQRLCQRKDQQRLTEELQTVENGYHDNPTLEVMETSSDMQEKKVVNLNGELGDSWIVPLDNLTKDDLDEEEDTHL